MFRISYDKYLLVDTLTKVFEPIQQVEGDLSNQLIITYFGKLRI